MSARPCEVQALALSLRLRAREWARWGHARHVCCRDRPSAGPEHRGPHVCACGLSWAHQASDNGPALWLRGPA